MDSFIDKFAQRKNAQEIIKANAAAEAQENDRLNTKLGQYEKAIQEIRKQNLLNIENAEKVKEVLQLCIGKIEEVHGADLKNEKVHLEELNKEIEEVLSQKLGEELESKLEEQKNAIDKMITDTEDFVHKENVKVYRNVQAVIQEELPKQTDDLKNAMIENGEQLRIPKAILPIGVLTMLFALASLVLNVLQFLNINIF